MSKYTTEIRHILSEKFDLGMDQYPIFDESYRNVLNTKILQHFMYREIGFETVFLFKQYLNRTLNEIMPLYNQYYESQLLKFDPITNYKGMETQTHDSDTTKDTSNNDHITVDDRKDGQDDSQRDTINNSTGSSDQHSGTKNKITDSFEDYKHVQQHTGKDTTVYDTKEPYRNVKTGATDHTGKDILDTVNQYSDTPQDAFPNSDIADRKFLTNATLNKDTTTYDSSESYNNITDDGYRDKTGNDHVDYGHTITDTDSGKKITDNNGTGNSNESHNDYSVTDEDLIRKYWETLGRVQIQNQVGNETGNVKEKWIKELEGYSGQSPSSLLNEFRSTFMNIDMLVINELEPLFMQIW